MIFIVLYFYIFLSRYSDRKINMFTVIGLFPMLLLMAVRFRQGSDTINAWILSPGLGLHLIGGDVSIAELLFN